MPIFEDTAVEMSGPLIGLAVLALAGPLVLPSSSWATLVKGGVKLFMEAEYGAEGQLIDQLVDTTVDQLLKVASHPDRPTQAAEAPIQRFRKTAQRRSRRYGWNERDHAARYHRHIARLKRRIAHLSNRRNGRTKQVLTHALDLLSEDARPPAASNEPNHRGAGQKK